MKKNIFYKNNMPTIKVVWKLMKGVTEISESLDRALTYVWLIGDDDRFFVPVTIVNNHIEFTVPTGIVVGNYGVKAVWVKDCNNFTENVDANVCYKNCLSEIHDVFAVTDYQEEGQIKKNCTITLVSNVATYGYDGLDAYEIACMRGKTTLKESLWIASAEDMSQKYNAIKADYTLKQSAIETAIAGANTATSNASTAANNANTKAGLVDKFLNGGATKTENLVKCHYVIGQNGVIGMTDSQNAHYVFGSFVTTEKDERIEVTCSPTTSYKVYSVANGLVQGQTANEVTPYTDENGHVRIVAPGNYIILPTYTNDVTVVSSVTVKHWFEGAYAAEKSFAENEAVREANESERIAQASSDHSRAESDHSTATGDHSIAAGDHSTATGDHSTATSDHSTATSDHSTATADSQQASSDHTASVSATSAANSAATSANQAAQETRLNEGAITDSAGDNTRWGKYYSNEGDADSSTAGDGTRWGVFKSKEAARDAAISAVTEYETKVDDLESDVTDLAQEVDTLNSGGLNMKDEVIASNVNNWLDEHPEATTTVQDKSLTLGKFKEKEMPFVTPEQFGAVADGFTDDAPALRLAATYASNNKIPIVLKGDATYYLASKSGSVVINAPYCYIVGNNARLKVADLGDFDSLICARGKNGYSNISNLTIEFNADNSTTQAGKGYAEEGARRTCFVLGGTRDGLGESYIQNVHIINAFGVWEFDFNLCKRGYIKDCVVDYSSQVMSWDRTSMYLWCNNFECSNNRLNGNGYGRTAIETHGFNITIRDNYITGYSAPILLTSIYDFTPSQTDSLVLVCKGNYCDCKQPLQVWANGNTIDKLLVCDNVVKVSNSTQLESGHGSCFWLYDEVSNCVINEIIISNNTFTQEEGYSPSVYIAPSRGSGLVINKWYFINNIFNCGYYFLCCKSWVAGNIVKRLKFNGNIINCANSTRLLSCINNNSTFENMEFTQNEFRNNPITTSVLNNDNGVLINWDSNSFENTITNATKNEKYKGLQNVDFSKVPVSLNTTGIDFLGRCIKNYIELFSTQTSSIYVDGEEVPIYEGWNKIYTNGKIWKLGNGAAYITNLRIADSMMGEKMEQAFFNSGAESLDLRNAFVANVSKMGQMFQNCANLKYLDVSGWYTGNVTNFYYCFGGLLDLDILDLSTWNFKSAANMDYMFNNSTGLKVLKLGECNISNVATAVKIFNNTTDLEKIIINKANESNITKVEGWLTNAGKTYTTNKTSNSDGTKNAVITITANT